MRRPLWIRPLHAHEIIHTVGTCYDLRFLSIDFVRYLILIISIREEDSIHEGSVVSRTELRHFIATQPDLCRDWMSSSLKVASGIFGVS